jgi:ArsR family transcriptional regulator, arsenate/arsenite/antimonite-responsive transcriptional repressor
MKNFIKWQLCNLLLWYNWQKNIFSYLSYNCDKRLCLHSEIQSMAINKKEAFSKQEQELAAFTKAISHPARIAILKILAQRNECICGEIVEVLPLSQSTTSQHLKALKDAGLISGTVDGPKSCYCINWKAFDKFNTDFNNLFLKLKKQNEKSCC